MSAGDEAFGAAERLAHALMFEGYVLYPYRRSSLKNVQRSSFGTLETRAQCRPGTSDASALRVECLVRGDAPALTLSVRFLQRVRRDDPGESEPWIEAIERARTHAGLDIAGLARQSRLLRFEHRLPGERSVEHGSTRRSGELELRITLGVEQLQPSVFKLGVDVENTRAEGDLLHGLGAVHVLMRVSEGRFASALEPPPQLAVDMTRCLSRGCFPVLVGPTECEEVMLASPIILYDRPGIAPESPGDFCDATEIDEMLTLRVLTLTEAERREAERTDARSRAILERTFAQSDEAVLALHGARRDPRSEASLEPPRTAQAPQRFEPGQSVLLRPKKGGDVLDLALAGERATIASVEEDFEGRVHYAVTIDADPGRDLGASGMPGHRFFFSAEELERVP